MFSKSADIYDAVYQGMGKDYAAEARKVHAFIQKFKRTSGDELLDVACGTGGHIGPLKQWYRVQGLDADEGMLKIARRKYPGVRFQRADMLDFSIRRKFDVITCLFSSIGYVKSVARLNTAVRNMSRHLKPGGVLILEPWFTPEDWETDGPHATFVDRPELKIARMNISGLRGRVSILNFHYLVGTRHGIRYFYERHELGLFTQGEYRAALDQAGLEWHHDRQGIFGRGLYIGGAPGGTR
jgi:SAM-dependent methyltransferase